MLSEILVKMFEHNLWANQQILQTCGTLPDEQLDAAPKTATKGSIRRTLRHLVDAEEYYLSLLSGREKRFDLRMPVAITELLEVSRLTGADLIALVKDDPSRSYDTYIQLPDGWKVKAWLIILQAVNHGTEHREQVKSMLNALGVTPPGVDGWAYADVAGASIPAAG